MEDELVPVFPEVDQEEIEMYIQKMEAPFRSFMREFFKEEKDIFAMKSTDIGDIYKKEY